MQVFLLVGQSSLEGEGAIRQIEDESTRATSRNLKRGGDRVVRDDVWITYDYRVGDHRSGGSTVGCNSTNDQAGPGLGCGPVLGDALEPKCSLSSAPGAARWWSCWIRSVESVAAARGSPAGRADRGSGSSLGAPRRHDATTPASAGGVDGRLRGGSEDSWQAPRLLHATLGMTVKTLERAAFVGSIPRDYDTYLGPFLFDFFAADLAARLEVGAGGSILETSCGTGISTEHLRGATDRGTAIVATDLSEAMLAYARAKRGHLENVRFEQADAAELPFGRESFDAVSSQFGLMFVPDKLRALSEAHRVLRPGGRLAFNVWDDLRSNPYVQVAQDAIASFFDVDPPTFLYQPWGFSALDPIKELLVQAGFVDIALSVVACVSERPSAHEVAAGLVRGNPTITEVEQRASAPVADVVASVAEALGDAFGAAPFRAPMQAIVATARRPDLPG